MMLEELNLTTQCHLSVNCTGLCERQSRLQKITMQNLLLVEQKVFLKPCLKIKSYTKGSAFTLPKIKGSLEILTDY